MDRKSLAQTLYRLARQDCIDDVGRLFLRELKYEIQQTLSSKEITELFKEFYPEATVYEATDRLLLIYFNGRQTTKNVRNCYTPVNNEVNAFKAKPDNDILFEADKESEQYDSECFYGENVDWKGH